MPTGTLLNKRSDSSSRKKYLTDSLSSNFSRYEKHVLSPLEQPLLSFGQTIQLYALKSCPCTICQKEKLVSSMHYLDFFHSPNPFVSICETCASQF